MPDQNLPVLGYGTHLIKIKEHIAHIYCVVTSSLHMDVAAVPASLRMHAAVFCSPMQETHRWTEHAVTVNAEVIAGKMLKTLSSDWPWWEERGFRISSEALLCHCTLFEKVVCTIMKEVGHR